MTKTGGKTETKQKVHGQFRNINTRILSTLIIIISNTQEIRTKKPNFKPKEENERSGLVENLKVELDRVGSYFEV